MGLYCLFSRIDFFKERSGLRFPTFPKAMKRIVVQRWFLIATKAGSICDSIRPLGKYMDIFPVMKKVPPFLHEILQHKKGATCLFYVK
jgi:hypothetical protein